MCPTVSAMTAILEIRSPVVAEWRSLPHHQLQIPAIHLLAEPTANAGWPMVWPYAPAWIPLLELHPIANQSARSMMFV